VSAARSSSGPRGRARRPLARPRAGARHPAGERLYRFAFDIGGTFTDLVIMGPDGRLGAGKCLTRPAAITRAVAEGLGRLLEREGIAPAAVREVVSGATTLVTNLIIERRGARTGLVTTGGFRDVLEMRREYRYDIYDLTAPFPEPLVPRALRVEVAERIDHEGAVVVPLDRAGARRAVEELVAAGVESIAVCLLHAYRNPVHERLVSEVAAAAAPSVHLSLSSEVLPELREYERASATVLNAYVRPLIGRYFEELEAMLRGLGIDATLHIMQSNGGVISRDHAEQFPIRMLESGPAAGALAGAHLGRQARLGNLLCFDMGGTTAKACLVVDGRPEITTDFETARVSRFKKGSGYPVKLPVVDLIEIGAGGGSIAFLDTTGLMKVGPRSAGAAPGPACYGFGGDEPTVTDADLLLGYLDPGYFLGGEMPLRPDLAEAAVRTRVAAPLGLSVVEAARGIYQIVSESMAAAARIHAAEKGRDLRRSTLLAFGGAGPVHAREVARRLGIRQVLVPVNAGVLSAIGLLVAPVLLDAVRSRFMRVDALDRAAVEALLEEMRGQALRALGKMDVRPDEVVFEASADMRYVGQGYEVTVPLGGDALDDPARLLEAFYRAYRRRFGRHLTGVGVEVLTWRLAARWQGPLPPRRPAPSRRRRPPAPRGRRAAYDADAGRFATVPVYDHYALEPGTRLAGPAIVEQRESTAVLGSGDRLVVDAGRNLLVTLGGAPR
jgi:N-methylhydantoinase A/oxoprolinase/acetone carboxylase beta subunit